MFFKKKKKKIEVDPKEQIEEAIYNMEAFVNKAESRRRALLEKAKLAKQRGDNLSYNMAVGSLKVIMQQQKRAEQMALSLGVMLDYREVSEFTKVFLDNMQNVCVQMSDLPNLKNLSKVSANFHTNVDKINRQNLLLDEYMQAFSENFNEGEEEVSVSADDEIGKMIERELSSQLSNEELQIQKKIDELKA